MKDVALRKESEKLGKINSTRTNTGKEMEDLFFTFVFPSKNKQNPVFPPFLIVPALIEIIATKARKKTHKTSS